MMNISQRMEILKKWYSRDDVLNEIVKFSQRRETGFIVPSWCDAEMRKASTQMLKCEKPSHFVFYMNDLGMFRRNIFYNFYSSIALYGSGIPYQDMRDMIARQEKNSKWFAIKHLDVVRCDFLIDIDSGNHRDISFAHESALMIKAVFDKYKLAYELRFSGCGFHFVIPIVQDKYSFYASDEINIYSLYSLIAKMLHDLYSEMVDWEIYDSRRFHKLPYTMANYENDVFVCLPIMGDEQFKNFDLNNYRWDAWLESDLIKDRETYLFNSDNVSNNWNALGDVRSFLEDELFSKRKKKNRRDDAV